MQLTDEQYAAARACGFAFFPATEAQVQRLSMQRRIFWIDAKPFMISCNGAYYETQGTLLRQIDDYLHRNLNCAGEAQMAPQQAEPMQGHALALSAAPERAASAVTLAQAHHLGDAKAELSTAQSRLPEMRSLPPAEALPSGEAATATPYQPLEHTAAPVQPAIGSPERGANADGVVSDLEASRPAPGRPRPRRLGQPKTPRWVTAGKARRGRLK